MQKSNVIKARELNGWTLDEACKHVGYANKGGLSKLEARSMSDRFLVSVNARVLCNLSNGYGVSIEYLLGLTNDPELSKSDIERGAVLRAVHDEIKTVSSDLAVKINLALTEALKYKNMRDELIDSSKMLIDSAQRMIELNQEEFQDLRNGANFERHLINMKNLMKAQSDKIFRDSRIAEMKSDDSVLNDSQMILDLKFRNQNS